MQDFGTKQISEEEEVRRAYTGLSSDAAPFPVVGVAAFGVMVLSTAVVSTVCGVVLGHHHGWRVRIVGARTSMKVIVSGSS